MTTETTALYYSDDLHDFNAIRCFFDDRYMLIRTNNSGQNPQYNWWESSVKPDDRENYPVLYFHSYKKEDGTVVTSYDAFCDAISVLGIESLRDWLSALETEDAVQDALLGLFGHCMTFRRVDVNEAFQPTKKPAARKAKNRRQRKHTQLEEAVKREEARTDRRRPCHIPEHTPVTKPSQEQIGVSLPTPSTGRERELRESLGIGTAELVNTRTAAATATKELQALSSTLGSTLKEDDFAPLRTTILGTLPAEISREYCQWLFEQTDGSTLRPVTHLADPNNVRSDLTIAVRHGDLDVDDRKFIKSAKGRLTRRLKKWVNA